MPTPRQVEAAYDTLRQHSLAAAGLHVIQAGGVGGGGGGGDDSEEEADSKKKKQNDDNKTPTMPKPVVPHLTAHTDYEEDEERCSTVSSSTAAATCGCAGKSLWYVGGRCGGVYHSDNEADIERVYEHCVRGTCDVVDVRQLVSCGGNKAFFEFAGHMKAAAGGGGTDTTAPVVRTDPSSQNLAWRFADPGARGYAARFADTSSGSMHARLVEQRRLLCPHEDCSRSGAIVSALLYLFVASHLWPSLAAAAGLFAQLDPHQIRALVDTEKLPFAVAFAAHWTYAATAGEIMLHVRWRLHFPSIVVTSLAQARRCHVALIRLLATVRYLQTQHAVDWPHTVCIAACQPHAAVSVPLSPPTHMLHNTTRHHTHRQGSGGERKLFRGLAFPHRPSVWSGPRRRRQLNQEKAVELLNHYRRPTHRAWYSLRKGRVSYAALATIAKDWRSTPVRDTIITTSRMVAVDELALYPIFTTTTSGGMWMYSIHATQKQPAAVAVVTLADSAFETCKIVSVVNALFDQGNFDMGPMYVGTRPLYHLLNPGRATQQMPPRHLPLHERGWVYQSLRAHHPYEDSSQQEEGGSGDNNNSMVLVEPVNNPVTAMCASPLAWELAMMRHIVRLASRDAVPMLTLLRNSEFSCQSTLDFLLQFCNWAAHLGGVVDCAGNNDDVEPRGAGEASSSNSSSASSSSHVTVVHMEVEMLAHYFCNALFKEMWPTTGFHCGVCGIFDVSGVLWVCAYDMNRLDRFYIVRVVLNAPAASVSVSVLLQNSSSSSKDGGGGGGVYSIGEGACAVQQVKTVCLSEVLATKVLPSLWRLPTTTTTTKHNKD